MLLHILGICQRHQWLWKNSCIWCPGNENGWLLLVMGLSHLWQGSSWRSVRESAVVWTLAHGWKWQVYCHPPLRQADIHPWASNFDFKILAAKTCTHTVANLCARAPEGGKQCIVPQTCWPEHEHSKEDWEASSTVINTLHTLHWTIPRDTSKRWTDELFLKASLLRTVVFSDGGNPPHVFVMS